MSRGRPRKVVNNVENIEGEEPEIYDISRKSKESFENNEEKEEVQKKVVFLGTGAVWDKSKNRVIVKFPRQIPVRDLSTGQTLLGEYRTSDKYIIDILDEMGYKRK